MVLKWMTEVNQTEVSKCKSASSVRPTKVGEWRKKLRSAASEERGSIDQTFSRTSRGGRKQLPLESL